MSLEKFLKFVILLKSKTIYLVYSFIVNIIYWIFNFNKLNKTLNDKKILKISIKNINDLKYIMSKFQWTRDKYWDWIPWIITIINKDYREDCDGAATLAKWLYKQLYIDADLVILGRYNLRNHMICIRKDRKQFVSNNEVIDIPEGEDWEFFIRECFNFEYKFMVVL